MLSDEGSRERDIDEGVFRWFGHVERKEVWESGKQGEWCRVGVMAGFCERV